MTSAAAARDRAAWTAVVAGSAALAPVGAVAVAVALALAGLGGA